MSIQRIIKISLGRMYLNSVSVESSLGVFNLHFCWCAFDGLAADVLELEIERRLVSNKTAAGGRDRTA